MNYLPNFTQGVKHLLGREPSDSVITHLTNGTGSRDGCLRLFASAAAAQCLLAWFKDGDLPNMRYWAFLAAKAQRMVTQNNPSSWWPAYIHLYPLLSNHRDLIEWYAKNRISYYLNDAVGDRDNPREAAFHGFQALLALNGQWSELESRSIEALGDLKVKQSKYGVDFNFYLGLARKDPELMKSTIEQLAGPLASVRNVEQAFGLTEKLISTHAVIYSKIAAFWGYEFIINSPWIPAEWIPMAPSGSRDSPWAFMNNFDVWQPYEGQWAAWSPSKE
ncbi:hypothetical protein [Roseateles amylovorans]|uniref:Alginate lyase domain-containing protein n=1 Tax=Roseateles amylovorans TaxID=2978473 RepID=A0ABY6B261_9BURK|nr:hypothetical protein [Roseateles amylovorans]UXH77375.1 hypothetical protein N4261_20575 [Roseateles amylovorans]